MVMKESDEELALFLEMRRREKDNEKNNLLLLQNFDEFDLSNLESNHGGANISMMVSSLPTRKTMAEELLNSENDKSDYDWLLAPPDSPLFPSLEKESHISIKSGIEILDRRPTALKPRVSNIQAEPASRSNVPSKHHAPKPGLGSSTDGNRRPSPSRGPTAATSRSSSSSGRTTLPSSNKSSRPSTPTSRNTLTASTKPITTQPYMAARKISQRSVTPTLLSSTTSRAFGVSAPPTRPSSASKARPVVAKHSVQSRGISPPVKSRPWEPSQMPGYSHDAPPNLKTSLPERSASVTRTRSRVPNSRSSSVEAGSNGKSKRQSITPSKGRDSSGYGLSNQCSMQALSRARFTDSDNESSVVIGTKMVERVVNMRKQAPAKNEDHHSAHSNSHGKPSSFDNSGFGLTLSKKSLDMAMIHMDIRRSMQGSSLRPFVTNIRGSSLYSSRSVSSSKSSTISISDTSSTASSEPSVNNHSISYDGSEVEENDFGSERGISSSMESSRIEMMV
ncbi:hypothetical protein Lalb_Chr03g0043161 [Lupinus albus]|uniref:Uncharacterized protein n=1 Tax=Lupinus albus TaxID=3870 RepID=A0A6A4QTK7_LUPAL|nr:hypothetical protein Lalb_Chr03g0043161 [Lupinus albus]